MIFSQGALLRLVAPHLSPALISGDEVAAIARFGDRLPRVFTWGILELRLAAGDTRADLEVCAGRRDGSHTGLARALAADDDAVAPWAGTLQPLLRTWGADDGRLADMPALALEYDTPAHGRLAPFVFLTTDHDIREGHALPPRPVDEVIELARDGLTLALGQLDEVAFSTWERCVRQLPAGGRVSSVAPLAPRGLRDLRLDAVVPRDAMVSWLDNIGWPGDRHRLAVLFDLLGPELHRYKVQLDTGATVGPMLGILYRPPDDPRNRPCWRRVLECLYAQGTCPHDKGEAALDWIGSEVVDLPDLDWPIVIQRDLDFKLTLWPDRIEAKSYFSYHAGWAPL